MKLEISSRGCSLTSMVLVGQRILVLTALTPLTAILTVALGLRAATEPSSPSPAPPGFALFSTNVVHRLRIEIAPQDLNRLRQNPRTDVPVTVHHGGQTYSEVGLHLKGRTGSFRNVDDKPGLTLRFDQFRPDRTFHGLTKIHLNNSVEDPAYLNEVLGTELMGKAGVPAPRVAHAWVELGTRNLGLYVLKEGFTREFLSLHFREAGGNLYEHQPESKEPGRLHRDFGDVPADHAEVKSLLAMAAEADLDRRWSYLQGALDMDRFISFIAVEVLMGHRDGYALGGNNYRLYYDPATMRLVFLPTGMDQIFRRADLPLGTHLIGPVARAVMEIPQARELYKQRTGLLFTNLFEPERLAARIRKLALPLRRAADPALARELEAQTTLLQERVARRIAFLTDHFTLPEAAPLRFTNNVAWVKTWRPVDVPEGGQLERVIAPDQRPALYIRAGPMTAASWRCPIILARGRYRFTANARTTAVKPLPFGRNQGVGLRVSGTRSPAPHQLIGDKGWTQLQVDFEMTAETSAELICELRAQAGEAWFELDSLRLIQLK